MKNRMTYSLVLSGLLIGMSIVLTRVFSMHFYIAGVEASRLSVGSVPIMLAGIILGPWWGAAVGALADVIGFLMFPNGAFFPPITLTSALVGLLPAFIYRLSGKAPEWLKAAISVTAVQVFCSLLLQTYWVTFFVTASSYGALLSLRAPVSLALIPIYFILIYSLLAGLKRAKLLPKLPA